MREVVVLRKGNGDRWCVLSPGAGASTRDGVPAELSLSRRWDDDFDRKPIAFGAVGELACESAMNPRRMDLIQVLHGGSARR